MNENLLDFVKALRAFCDNYIQNATEKPATELFPEPEAKEDPKPAAKWKDTLHYTRKHRENGRSGVARSDFRAAMVRQGVPISMNDLKTLMKDLNIDGWSEGREVRFSERYIGPLLSAIKERF